MTLEEVREVLKKKMLEISQMEVLQSEKPQLVFDALEQFRRSSNKIRQAEEQQESKRIQNVISGWKNDKKVNETRTKKYLDAIRKNQTRETIKSLAGSEALQEFIEKFGGRK